VNWIELFTPRACLGGVRERMVVLACSPFLLILIVFFVVFIASTLLRLCVARRRAQGITQGTGGSRRAESEDVSIFKSLLGAATDGLVMPLPVTLFILFLSVPLVSSVIFSPFSCERFGLDDARNRSMAFMASDYSVACDGSQYQKLTAMAIGFAILWVVIVPFFFACILFPSRVTSVVYIVWNVCAGQRTTRQRYDVESTHLAKPEQRANALLDVATQFLHHEYKDGFRWWELVELCRKLILTGFVLLIPRHFIMLRLVLAQLVSIGYLVLLTVTSPYRRRTTVLFALAANMTLICTLIVAILIHAMPDDISIAQQHGFSRRYAFGTCMNSGPCLGKMILTFNFGVLGFALVLLVIRLWKAKPKNVLLLRQTNELPTLALKKDKAWHLFLSHKWTNKDVITIIQQKLTELLLGVRVFLDIQDLESVGDIEAHVVSSQAMLILLGDPDYFTSPNCMKEAASASDLDLPLILVHDAKNEAYYVKNTNEEQSLSNLKERCLCSNLKEIHSRKPPSELYAYLFHDLENEADPSPENARPCYPWDRTSPCFQLQTLALIAEKVVLACPTTSMLTGRILSERQSRDNDSGRASGRTSERTSERTSGRMRAVHSSEEPGQSPQTGGKTRVTFDTEGAEKHTSAKSGRRRMSTVIAGGVSEVSSRLSRLKTSMLQAPEPEVKLHVQDAWAFADPAFHQSVKLYVSKHNVHEGAKQIREEIENKINSVGQGGEWSKVEFVEDLKEATHFVLFLSRDCFYYVDAQGAFNIDLAHEVHQHLNRLRKSLRLRNHNASSVPDLVLIFSPESDPWEIIMDQTPNDLKDSDYRKMYDMSMAIPWRSGLYLEVSMNLLARRLGARKGRSSIPHAAQHLGKILCHPLDYVPIVWRLRRGKVQDKERLQLDSFKTLEALSSVKTVEAINARRSSFHDLDKQVLRTQILLDKKVIPRQILWRFAWLRSRPPVRTPRTGCNHPVPDEASHVGGHMQLSEHSSPF